MVLEKLKKLADLKNKKNGGLAGTGLFAKSPEIDFAQGPEAEVGPYKGITGGAGFPESDIERMLPDEESKEIYRKELAKQLARERKRQVKEIAKEKAKERVRSGGKKSRPVGAEIVGGGPEIDIIGTGEGGGGNDEEIPLI